MAACLCVMTMSPSAARPEVLSLKLHNLHTQEKATIVFKRNGVYDQAGLRQLNQFLRDWRKDKPTKMDPHLFDLLHQVYQQSGASGYIDIICGYRSPATNGMLRRRSSGVAENSLHMQGKAIDFAIPGVKLAKLRAIGMRLQVGGVGFYPTSGSPFVHMDTGSVRAWPRMTRQELVSIFPNGGTLHIPADGKPLPGYAEALAAYKARKASGTAIATFAADEPAPAARDTRPIQLASADVKDDAAQTAAPAKTIAVAVASYAPDTVPMPRLAPRHSAPLMVASLVPTPSPRPTPAPTVATVAAATTTIAALSPDFDFGSAQDWTSPAVPAELARAMAERDHMRRGSSLPIQPTAVVATIDVNRPLRAQAITTAVLRGGEAPVRTVNVMAYAPMDAAPAPREPRRVILANAVSMPMPQLNPRHHTRAVAARDVPASHAVERPVHLDAPALTMTALDTAGLRLWIGTTSTRQRSYALLTMPSFADMPGIMAKPTVSFGAGFGQFAYADLRTDRFTGPLVQPPAMVDLTFDPLVASIR